jgi:hypothetical protein
MSQSRDPVVSRACFRRTLVVESYSLAHPNVWFSIVMCDAPCLKVQRGTDAGDGQMPFLLEFLGSYFDLRAQRTGVTVDTHRSTTFRAVASGISSA